MNLLQRRGLGLAFLALASLASTAQADTLSGKITHFLVSSNSSTDHHEVMIGSYTYRLYVAGASATFLREAFLRKLTVTVNFTPTISIPYTGPTGNIINVSMKSGDIP